MIDNILLVLGTVQDGGYPHVGCNQSCCKHILDNPNAKKMVASIAIIDNFKKHVWIIDATPDINNQIRLLNQYIPSLQYPNLSGIFLTHAHMGHYTGLLNLGLESMNLKNIPIYVLDQMESFIENNSMLNQLIINKNITINKISNNEVLRLNDSISIKPFYVPHRNELSETAGFNIITEKKSVIYIPDIDSWSDWDIEISDLVKEHDLLLLDGTFYSKEEIKHRDLKKIPHPSIVETMNLLESLSIEDKNKIFFTHLNHTNNALRMNSNEYNNIITSGYNILNDKQIFEL